MIRKATADDIRAMMDLAAESATAAQWTEQQYRDLISPGANVHRLAIVAEGSLEQVADSRVPIQGILGFLIARLLTSDCELENIAVSPAVRRRGIGRQLLECLNRAASEANCESVFLEFRESNQTARAFYERVGFKPDGRRKSYYSNPSEDAILYRLQVPLNRSHTETAPR